MIAIERRHDFLDELPSRPLERHDVGADLPLFAARGLHRLLAAQLRLAQDQLGLKGFRFGSRLFGREGYTGGAWLNGETRTDGFSLDGRVEREGKAHNFKMNIDLDEWLKRAVRWWSGGLTDL